MCLPTCLLSPLPGASVPGGIWAMGSTTVLSCYPHATWLACVLTFLLHSAPLAWQGVAGISCLWRVAEYWRRKYDLPEQLPPKMAERLRPARQKALHKVPSLQHAAAGGSDDEVGAGDEEEEDDYDPGGRTEEAREAENAWLG